MPKCRSKKVENLSIPILVKYIQIKEFPDFDFDFDLASIPTYLRLRLRIAYNTPPLISEKYSNVSKRGSLSDREGGKGWAIWDLDPKLGKVVIRRGSHFSVRFCGLWLKQAIMYSSIFAPAERFGFVG